MSELVERVARAVAETPDPTDPGITVGESWVNHEPVMEAIALAAIAEVLSAMEEPSEAMRLAAMSAYCDKVSAVAAYKQGDSDFSKGLKSGLGMVSSSELDAAYQAMLSQFRKEIEG